LSDNKPYVQPAIDRFMKAHPDIKVKAVGYSNDGYKTKIKVALGTPNGPDIFHTWGGGEFSTYVKAGQVQDISSLVTKAGLDKSIGKGVLAAGQVNDVQYALPVAVEASMVWYRTDVFQKLNLTPPKTWAEFLTVIKTLKDAGYIPIAMANKTMWPGGHWWSEVTTQTCGPDFVTKISSPGSGLKFTDPCIIEAGKRIQELVKAGAFNKGFNGLDYDSGESRTLFWSGKAAMNHMGSWTIDSAKKESPAMLKNMNFFPLPQLPIAKGTSAMMSGGIAPQYAISKSSKNMTAAEELLIMMTDEKAGQDAANAGRIPVIAGTQIPEPLTQAVATAIAAAPNLIAWPDQFLPPELSSEMLTTTQSLFGLSMTPEQAAQALDKVAQRVVK
jgi:raffinose/stachyose/melibiose transport system substrate-binding protein